MRSRDIAFERTVTQDIEEAIKDKHYRMVDEAMQGVEWTLAHKPESGVHHKGRFWVYKQIGFKPHRIPEIVVLYTFTDDKVTLEAVLFRPAE
jgi:hypothetical protein